MIVCVVKIEVQLAAIDGRLLHNSDMADTYTRADAHLMYSLQKHTETEELHTCACYIVMRNNK